MLTAGELAEYMPSLRGLINGRYELEEDPYRPPPTVRRQLVDALIARMEPAGTEELRGVLTWRYRLTLDEEQAMEVLADDIVAELAWGQYERPVYESLDVWLDAEGRARRIVGQAGLFGEPARIGYELWIQAPLLPCGSRPTFPGGEDADATPRLLIPRRALGPAATTARAEPGIPVRSPRPARPVGAPPTPPPPPVWEP